MNIHGLTARLRSTARKVTRLNRRSDGTPYIRRVVAAPLAVGLLATVGFVAVTSSPDADYWGSTLGDESVEVEVANTAWVDVVRNSPVPGLTADLKIATVDAPDGVWVTVVGDNNLLIDVRSYDGPGEFEVGYTVAGVDPDTGDTHRSYEVAYVHVNARGAA